MTNLPSFGCADGNKNNDDDNEDDNCDGDMVIEIELL